MKKIVASVLALMCLGGMSSSAQAGYDLPYIGDEQIYVATADDTLVHIARAQEMGFVEMRAANPDIDPWVPGAGTELVLPKRHILPDAPHDGIVINLPEMRLYAFVNGNKEPTTFPLGIGREGLETPIGSTTVVRKQAGPTWRPTPRMRREDPSLPESVGPGAENPLGTHALYLGWPQYALHGTNKPYGIGRRISSGCLRLYPENITQLFEMIPIGTKVTVVNQPIKLAWIDDVLYMEAHPDMDQAIQMEETGQVFSAKMTDQDMAFIVNAAGAYKDKLHWATIRNEVRNRSGRPVMIARREGAKIGSQKPEVIYGRDQKKAAMEQDEAAVADVDVDQEEARAAEREVESVPAEEAQQDDEAGGTAQQAENALEDIYEQGREGDGSDADAGDAGSAGHDPRAKSNQPYKSMDVNP